MNKRAGELTDDEVMWYFIFLTLYVKYTVNYAVVIYQNKHWGKFTVWDIGWGHTWAFFTVVNESLPW